MTMSYCKALIVHTHEDRIINWSLQARTQ